jgi:hypothetical protein
MTRIESSRFDVTHKKHPKIPSPICRRSILYCLHGKRQAVTLLAFAQNLMAEPPSDRFCWSLVVDRRSLSILVAQSWSDTTNRSLVHFFSCLLGHVHHNPTLGHRHVQPTVRRPWASWIWQNVRADRECCPTPPLAPCTARHSSLLARQVHNLKWSSQSDQ